MRSSFTTWSQAVCAGAMTLVLSTRQHTIKETSILRDEIFVSRTLVSTHLSEITFCPQNLELGGTRTILATLVIQIKSVEEFFTTSHFLTWIEPISIVERQRLVIVGITIEITAMTRLPTWKPSTKVNSEIYEASIHGTIEDELHIGLLELDGHGVRLRTTIKDGSNVVKHVSTNIKPDWSASAISC